MAETFYPFVEQGNDSMDEQVKYPARIAVYDDAAAAPRVLVVEPTDVRAYLEEITDTVTRAASEQGGHIPFMVIREIVENLIHAYFAEPTISILDGGDTICFADQGPGIADKARAMQYGTTSATNEMKRYIRGVGSGLPYAQQWLSDKGGALLIEDNISRGTVVTITLVAREPQAASPTTVEHPQTANQGQISAGTASAWAPATAASPYPVPANPYPQPQLGYQQPSGYPQPLVSPYAVPAAYVPTGASPLPPAWQMAQMTAQPSMQAMPYPPAPAYTASAYAPATPPPPATTRVSERGMMALGYLATHESVGPTELVATFGHSQSTWTRELKALEDCGLIAKRGGQKRFLTPAGHAFLTR